MRTLTSGALIGRKDRTASMTTSCWATVRCRAHREAQHLAGEEVGHGQIGRAAGVPANASWRCGGIG